MDCTAEEGIAGDCAVGDCAAVEGIVMDCKVSKAKAKGGSNIEQEAQ